MVGKGYSIGSGQHNDQRNSRKEAHRGGGGGDYWSFVMGNSGMRRMKKGILRELLRLGPWFPLKRGVLRLLTRAEILMDCLAVM